jgi:UDPglucose 6-dehydrogenase
MKISVIGLGYLGATHAVAMASLGHEVIGIEPDSIRTAQLKAGITPFHEPGLQQALDKVLAAGNISFQCQHDDQSAAADIHFICVGTPQAADKSADTSFVFAAAAELAKVLKPASLVVGKSTVPVGVARKLISQMAAISGFEPKLCWNPEFLREGTALEDSLHPIRTKALLEPRVLARGHRP